MGSWNEPGKDKNDWRHGKYDVKREKNALFFDFNDIIILGNKIYLYCIITTFII